MPYYQMAYLMELQEYHQLRNEQQRYSRDFLNAYDLSEEDAKYYANRAILRQEQAAMIFQRIANIRGLND